jgi:hypothetical protein
MAVKTTGAKVGRASVTINGISYFRGNAPAVRLVSYGKKRQPITGMNYLDVDNHIAASNFTVIKAATFDIDYGRTTAEDLTADVEPAVLKFAGGSVSAARELATEGLLKFVMLNVLPAEIEEYINNTPRVRDELLEEGDDVRVVLQTLRVVEGKIADSVQSTTKGSLSATVKGIKVALDGSRSVEGRTELEFSHPSNFGYTLGRLEWDHERRNRRTKVTAIRLDEHGA